MAPRNSKKIFLIDDHALVRSGLKAEIESDGTYQVSGTASSIREGIKIMSFSPVDLLICDVSLQGENGIQEFQSLKSKFPDLKIVFLTMHKDWSYLQDAVAAGADGYLLKSDSTDSILSSIKKVFAGGRVFPGEIANFSYNPIQIEEAREAVQKLTKREKDILAHLAKGKLNREIAENLELSVRTVETHRASILKKLQIENTVELTRLLVQLKSLNFL
ncbi:response regulator [Leptospira wolffii]|uniref:Response regulator n=1 Tax=Leptospira wolffii TaxID=409998 RepID=A0A2M9Z771_9LEPT|nr:response regulator transcription factor [Leptospira wolffii]PJZ64281.1 DNA-binding response regulator [Leptospira wolffii]TGK55924.1 DNA-binding response regulator [Leptospira wolffii]TGK71970.1 DNA-binding response regulator [Leptospira wolffii]TGK78624.1 DNA-binding response regulator [Leptospira wolffii]TGL27547.1 DNA-binding response regulator [Leptospira wolffii]